uniref:Uncharacterized protein n=1 Tax=Arundo donax TaxID=35708 RepID=A0A0A8ZQZ2_ARUDO
MLNRMLDSVVNLRYFYLSLLTPQGLRNVTFTNFLQFYINITNRFVLSLKHL